MYVLPFAEGREGFHVFLLGTQRFKIYLDQWACLWFAWMGLLLPGADDVAWLPGAPGVDLFDGASMRAAYCVPETQRTDSKDLSVTWQGRR